MYFFVSTIPGEMHEMERQHLFFLHLEALGWIVLLQFVDNVRLAYKSLHKNLNLFPAMADLNQHKISLSWRLSWVDEQDFPCKVARLHRIVLHINRVRIGNSFESWRTGHRLYNLTRKHVMPPIAGSG